MNLLKSVDMCLQLPSFAFGCKLSTYAVFSTILPPDLKSELRILTAYFWTHFALRVEVKKLVSCFKYWFTYWRFWSYSDFEYQLNLRELSVVIRFLIKRISGYLITDHGYCLEFQSTEVSRTTVLDHSSQEPSL